MKSETDFCGVDDRAVAAAHLAHLMLADDGQIAALVVLVRGLQFVFKVGAAIGGADAWQDWLSAHGERIIARPGRGSNVVLCLA